MVLNSDVARELERIWREQGPAGLAAAFRELATIAEDLGRPEFAADVRALADRVEDRDEDSPGTPGSTEEVPTDG